MKQVKILTAAAIALCLLTGCHSGDSSAKSVDRSDIVGTWVQTMADGTETMTFNSDGTYHKVIKLSGAAPVTKESDDTWTLEGASITIQYSAYNTSSQYTVTVDGSTMTWDNGDSQIVYTKK